MGRRRKPYSRSTPACAVDDDFFKRAEAALGRHLNANARSLIALEIELHNKSSEFRVPDKRRGRPSDLATHLIVESLLSALEGEVGITVRTSKRAGKTAPMPGPVPAFLRIVWEALDLPERDANGFARLSANASRLLGKSASDRRANRAQRRKPRDDYSKRLSTAWKG